MNWEYLTEEAQIEAIKERSFQQPVVIFKHSIRCVVSSMVKTRLDNEENPEHVSFYYLDLITYRSVSNKVAEVFGVRHESPQVLLIRNGECIYNESHNGIYMSAILEEVA